MAGDDWLQESAHACKGGVGGEWLSRMHVESTAASVCSMRKSDVRVDVDSTQESAESRRSTRCRKGAEVEGAPATRQSLGRRGEQLAKGKPWLGVGDFRESNGCDHGWGRANLTHGDGDGARSVRDVRNCSGALEAHRHQLVPAVEPTRRAAVPACMQRYEDAREVGRQLNLRCVHCCRRHTPLVNVGGGEGGDRTTYSPRQAVQEDSGGNARPAQNRRGGWRVARMRLVGTTPREGPRCTQDGTAARGFRGG
eukprot:scaffold53827_cov28-Tisochrysis_lutea.AAC.4